MNIVVLAGGLSTERDVSFKTGDMVSKALRENGHNVILLDVFMGYSDKEENLTGIFDRTEEVSVQVKDIPETAPDLAKVKASRKDQSDCFFGLMKDLITVQDTGGRNTEYLFLDEAALDAGELFTVEESKKFRRIIRQSPDVLQ